MKNFFMTVVIAVILSVAASIVIVRTMDRSTAVAETATAAPKAEEAPVTAMTAHERVIKTQTLRCGYIPFVPNLVKDPNTGKLSGLDVDVAEAVARKLGVKVEWTEEVGWATAVPGLKAKKFDALCNAVWVNPAEAKEAYFSRPYYYAPLFVAVRADDTRFDAAIDKLNDPGVSIVSQDGDNPKFIAEQDFPKAKIFTLPDMAGMGMAFESIRTGKADATFTDAYQLGDYNEHNPGKLKLTQLDNPVRIYPVAFILPVGDDEFRFMIDAAMDELIYSGGMDKILKSYEKYPHSFLPIDHPRVVTGR